jgi:hypothetical protein
VIDVALGPSVLAFSSPCYYALAGEPFTIEFSNNVVLQSTGATIPVNILVSPSNKEAVQQAQNDLGYVFNGANADVVSQTISTSTPAAISIPALPPGNYVIQVQQFPGQAIATLVVG